MISTKPLSNRERQWNARRAKRTLDKANRKIAIAITGAIKAKELALVAYATNANAGASQGLRISTLGQGMTRGHKGAVLHTMPVLDSKGQAKSFSRIPKAWSDTHRVQAIPSIEYMPEHWLNLNARGLRFNPHPYLPNVQRLKGWDAIKRRHVTRLVDIGMPGEYRRAPAIDGEVWRGPACLFDDCQAMTRASALAYNRKPNVAAIKYHQPKGSLPEWQDARVRAPTAREMALEVLVADWRARQQLAYLQMMGVEL